MDDVKIPPLSVASCNLLFSLATTYQLRTRQTFTRSPPYCCPSSNHHSPTRKKVNCMMASLSLFDYPLIFTIDTLAFSSLSHSIGGNTEHLIFVLDSLGDRVSVMASDIAQALQNLTRIMAVLGI